MKKDIIDLILILWVITLTVVYGSFLESSSDRIDELEEKAKHFKCLENRISEIDETAERRHSEEYYWTSTNDTLGNNIRIIEKDGFNYCPFCGKNINLNLAHTCVTITKYDDEVLIEKKEGYESRMDVVNDSIVIMSYYTFHTDTGLSQVHHKVVRIP